MYLQPRLYSDYQIFEGNKTDPDNFEVILVDGEHVLVGGRNTVYKLQLRDLKLRQLLEWNSSEQDKSVCLVKGKSETFCQNYIKVLKKFENDEGRYLMCGTNAFKPECREYVEDAGTYLMTKKSKGVGMCPYSPEHNSTSVLVQDQLYAGTAADYQVSSASSTHFVLVSRHSEHKSQSFIFPVILSFCYQESSILNFESKFLLEQLRKVKGK